MIRLFVGLPVPEAICERLAGLSGGVPGARWIAPENMHITLKFIGDVENGLAEDIDTALQTLRAAPITLNLRGAGFFGKAYGGRMIWAGVEPTDALSHLQGKIEAILDKIGIARETRKFVPHVTIARLKKAPAARVEAFVADHASFAAGPFEISEVTLFSSYLASTGATYTPEATYPLSTNL